MRLFHPSAVLKTSGDVCVFEEDTTCANVPGAQDNPFRQVRLIGSNRSIFGVVNAMQFHHDTSEPRKETREEVRQRLARQVGRLLAHEWLRNEQFKQNQPLQGRDGSNFGVSTGIELQPASVPPHE